MILYIHSNASYLSISKGKSRAGGVLFLCTQTKDPTKPPTVLPETNVPIYIECSIMRSIIASTMEAKLGTFFASGQK